MAFSIVKRDWVNFEVEGFELKALVRRPTAKQQIQFEGEVDRMNKKLKANPEENISQLLVMLYIDYLTDVVQGIEGLETDSVYPADTDERKEFYNQAGFIFINTLINAILKSGRVDERESKK